MSKVSFPEKKIAQMPATLANKADVFRVPGIVWNFKLSSP